MVDCWFVALPGLLRASLGALGFLLVLLGLGSLGQRSALEVIAEARGGALADHFNGFVNLHSSLRLAAPEAEEFCWLADRGMPVGLGSMLTLGGTAPVTPAAAISLHLAEQLFISIIRRVFLDDPGLAMACSISAADMSTAMHTNSRPEQQLCMLAMAQIARRYRTRFSASAGRAEARLPGVEAGMQKVFTTLPLLLATGRATVACGTLAVGEVFSPLQMLLDHELVCMLQRFARGFEVDEGALACSLISSRGPGATYLDADHTARRWRATLWQPGIWSHQTLDAWERDGARSELDKGREQYLDLLSGPDPEPGIEGAIEEKLLRIAASAGVEPGP